VGAMIAARLRILAACVPLVVACSAGGGGDPVGSGPGAGASGGTAAGEEELFIPDFGEERRCGESDAVVLFVVDRSGSMNCNLPPITGSEACEATPVRADPTAPSKWEATTGTLSAAFDSLIADGLTVKAGLTYFSQDDECGVLSQPTVPVVDLAFGHIETMRTSLATTQPAGGTPLVGATVAAYKHLHQQLTEPGDRYVVLLTDGSDQCFSRYDAALGPQNWESVLLDVEMRKALSVNIRTFVIGAPGSESGRHFLSRMAMAGGTARPGCDVGGAPDQGDCHYDMTTGDFTAALAGALSEITGIVTCGIVR
jgi:hypothetical protein